MKVADMTGSLLDLWVARAEKNNASFAGIGRFYTPSTNWAHGGPLIEKNRIDLNACLDDGGQHDGWIAFADGVTHVGPTVLIAAMRVLVEMSFGPIAPADEVQS